MVTNDKNELVKWVKQNVDFVKVLNFSDEEIFDNIYKILSVYNELQQCQQQDGKCINDYEMHEVFYRTKNQKLAITFEYCKKHQKTNNNYLKNYWIKEFPDQWDSYSFNKENIASENDYYSWREKILKILKKQLTTQKYTSLYVSGDFGIGKSYIFALFCNEAAKQNKQICFVNFANFANYFRKNFSGYDSNKEFWEYTEKMNECDILVIDELGIEKFNYWMHIEVVLPILLHRYKQNLPVYFISNLDLKKLELKYIGAVKSYASKNEKENNTILVKKFIQVIYNLIDKNEIKLLGNNWLLRE